MFQTRMNKTKAHAAAGVLSVIYLATVRNVRKTHGNAVMALLLNILQTLILLLAFYVMINILGMRSRSVRGDYVLYIMSGIFLFMTHTKAMGAVAGSEGPASAMMKHAPMSTAVAISSSALAALYIQLLSVSVILFVYDIGFKHIEIYKPFPALGMFLLAWFSGVAIGMVFLAVKPWFPNLTGIISTIYARANMIASGKMFLANTMPTSKIALFSWNPLFHTIDQARGYTFINYNPHYSSYQYAIRISLILLMIGLMGEFYTRKHASVSWQARK